MELGEGDTAAGGDHEKLADGCDALGLHGVHERALLFEEGIHEGGEGEVGLGVGGETGEMEEKRVAGGEAGDLAAAREAELAVELAGVGEGEAMAGETGEEGLGADDEAEVGIAIDNGLEVEEPAAGVGLDGPYAGALQLLPELLPLPAAEEGEDVSGRGSGGSGAGGDVRVRVRFWGEEGGKLGGGNMAPSYGLVSVKGLACSLERERGFTGGGWEELTGGSM